MTPTSTTAAPDVEKELRTDAANLEILWQSLLPQQGLLGDWVFEANAAGWEPTPDHVEVMARALYLAWKMVIHYRMKELQAGVRENAEPVRFLDI